MLWGYRVRDFVREGSAGICHNRIELLSSRYGNLATLDHGVR